MWPGSVAAIPKTVAVDLRRNLLRQAYSVHTQMYVAWLVNRCGSGYSYEEIPWVYHVCSSLFVMQGCVGDSSEYANSFPAVVAKHYMTGDASTSSYLALAALLRSDVNSVVFRNKLLRLVSQCVRDGHLININLLRDDLLNWSRGRAQIVRERWINAMALNCSDAFIKDLKG